MACACLQLLLVSRDQQEKPEDALRTLLEVARDRRLAAPLAWTLHTARRWWDALSFLLLVLLLWVMVVVVVVVFVVVGAANLAVPVLVLCVVWCGVCMWLCGVAYVCACVCV